MRSLAKNGGGRGVSLRLTRMIPFGVFASYGTFAAVESHYLLAGLLGVGAVATGRRLLDRKENRRKELSRRARENSKELMRVARDDRVAATQMKRLSALQNGLLESWDLLPEEYRPLLDEDVFAIVGEVQETARLARRRAALRRHLESVDRRGISRRIKGLEKDLAALEPGSPLRTPFEVALEGRRGELEGYEDVLNGVSMINAQLEGAESLLANLRGELLALNTNVVQGSPDPGLAHLKARISYFRRSLDEVARSVDALPATERIPAR